MEKIKLLKRIMQIGYISFFIGFCLDMIGRQYDVVELFNDLAVILVLLGCLIVFCIFLISFIIYIITLISNDKYKVSTVRALVLKGILVFVLYFAWATTKWY
jgi:Kef-type K+ transport system membrane component KefB